MQRSPAPGDADDGQGGGSGDAAAHAAEHFSAAASFPGAPDASVAVAAASAPRFSSASSSGAAGALGTGGGAVVWHVPSWASEWVESFEGHAYSHAEDFAGVSKPANPDHFTWLCAVQRV